MVAVALGVLAVILVGPGPIWVGHWKFLRSVPRAAVVLWQAGAVAALVAVLGAGAVAVGEVLDDRPFWRDAAYAVVLLFAVVVAARLVWSMVTVGRQTSARRARHRAAVDLLAQVDTALPVKGLRILAAQLPMAYCLPGVRDSRVVLSAGTLALLTTDEVQAVIAHESAHVRARHDLVLDTFTALHRAFPHLVRSRMPVQQCTLLVEMLADDAARRRVGSRPLAQALIALSGAPSPDGALAAAGSDVVLRVQRLAAAPPPRWLAAGVYALAAGLVLFPIGLLVLLPS